MKRLVLAGLATLAVATAHEAAWAAAYKEAPALAEQVKHGKLPPVAQRVSDEPLVVKPYDKIGKYGGTLSNAEIRPDTLSADINPDRETIFKISHPDLETIQPNLATGYQIEDGGRTVTITLRKGVRWSDGDPFDADDIMFWYNDVLLNKKLTPVIDLFWIVGGEVMKLEKVDDLTIRMRFAQPYSRIAAVLTSSQGQQGRFFLPKHFMQRYHIDFNPQANEVAKAEGYDSWDKAFRYYTFNRHLGTPTVSAWMTEKQTPEEYLFVRNPYYWKIDPEGNQLPYLDKVQQIYVSDQEAINLMAIDGRLTYESEYLVPANLALYKQNEAKHGYRTLVWSSDRGAVVAIALNATYTEDPTLRPILASVDFRRALSLGIDREEINQLVLLGLGKPRQATIDDTVSFFDPAWATTYAEFDPARANAILDKMGLAKRGSDGYRLRPDGQPLKIRIEFVTQYWQEVGVNTEAISMQKAFYDARTQGGKVAASVWDASRSFELALWVQSQGGLWWASPHRLLTYGHAWRLWYESKGENPAGEEPPPEMKKVFDLWEKWVTTEFRSPEYTKIGKEIMQIFADNLWMIGTAGGDPVPVIIDKNLKNVPEQGIWGVSNLFTYAYNQEQWFLDR